MLGSFRTIRVCGNPAVIIKRTFEALFLNVYKYVK
jgi:hypothetical protein